MRLGIMTSLGTTSAEEWAKAHAKLGGRCVTFPLDCSAPESLVDEYVKAAQAHDLLIAEVGVWRNAISRDPAERKKNLDYSIGQLRLAERVGARCCVNVAGAYGPADAQGGLRWDGAYKENFSEEARKETVKMVQTVIDEVQPKNAYFSLEPMPWMLPTSPEEYLQLIEEVGRDRFAVHMDIINMINCPERYFFSEDFLEHSFDLLGPYIRSCHLKSIRLEPEFTFRLSECECSLGNFSIERYAELATKYDPDMPLLIEHLSSDEEYIKSLKYVQERLGVR